MSININDIDTQKIVEFYNAIGDTLEDLKQANIISTTLSDKAESVGYTLSDSMTGIWDTSTGNITQVLTTYGKIRRNHIFIQKNLPNPHELDFSLCINTLYTCNH